MLPGFVMGTTDNNLAGRVKAVDKRVLVLFLSTELCLDRVARVYQADFRWIFGGCGACGRLLGGGGVVGVTAGRWGVPVPLLTRGTPARSRHHPLNTDQAVHGQDTANGRSTGPPRRPAATHRACGRRGRARTAPGGAPPACRGGVMGWAGVRTIRGVLTGDLLGSRSRGDVGVARSRPASGGETAHPMTPPLRITSPSKAQPKNRRIQTKKRPKPLSWITP